jgi:hypothetical protein
MASPREVANASTTSPSARGWIWEFLAVVLCIRICLAIVSNTAPGSGLGKPWSWIITLVIAIIAGASVVVTIRRLRTRFAGKRAGRRER